MPVPVTRGTPGAVAARPPAGYDAEKLDQLLGQYITLADRNLAGYARLAVRMDEAVKQLLDTDACPECGRGEEGVIGDGTPGGAVEALTLWTERLARCGVNVVKALDDLTRLRSFLAGGPDSRPDLSTLGEQAIREKLEQTMARMGFKLIPVRDVTPEVIHVA